MRMKTLLLGVGLGALVSLSALTSPAQTNQKQTQAASDTVTVRVLRAGQVTELKRRFQWDSHKGYKKHKRHKKRK